VKPLRVIALASVAAVALLSARAASAQASAPEMSSFPMPPPSGYHATKTFAYVGDYGYYTAPAVASPGTSSNASDYRYVRYRGVSGKRVFVYGAWGPSVPPPPSGGGDACPHTHASYGVWAYWELGITWFGPSTGWFRAGGGGMSGVRNAKGECEHRTDTSLADIDARFGWGREFESFDFRLYPFVKELVVGALSNTHGWGTCKVPRGGFPACHEPSYIIGYTLP